MEGGREAEATIPLPIACGELNFVVATVPGHLFGIAAAQAIDRPCAPFHEVRAVLPALPVRPCLRA